ncbi:helix-turn-helix domain-containing protein, partial [Anoxybacillus sp. KU2-6(11)]|uniref:helix-turn-helix domain-containing protein n=1 Tax=Anoxybacillus sp. KU2-6(11) TaxID=1535751 RepID=UPI00350EAAC8
VWGDRSVPVDVHMYHQCKNDGSRNVSRQSTNNKSKKIVDRSCICVAIYAMDSFAIATNANENTGFNFARKKGALYSTLIRLANSYGVETEDGMLIDFPMTNQELANFCGSAREVVSRLLKELKERGVISATKGKITIHDVQFLKDEIRCEGCPIDICNMK